MISLPSAVEKFTFYGRDFYVKRDDLLDSYLSGNKFRKLYTLYNTSSSTYKKVISYGGTQSNAMLSIAYLCHLKGWEFEYYCRPVALHVKKMNEGNLAQALRFGMRLHEVEHEHFEQEVTKLFFNVDSNICLIAQGGADKIAHKGVKVLADEITLWKDQNKISNLHVITPSGTGTTAFYLAKELECDCYTTAVVGSTEYLNEELKALGQMPKNLHVIATEKKYHFAKLYREFLALYLELKECGIEFDLLYAPKTWLALLENLDAINGDILYVHSGGVYGNGTMLERYRHKGWLR
ncbi:MAG: pyridoxal-phosphate dependent enzyme [Campylobacterota bacterium]|nr:pyridoxal-phosphate dependent enzyme [Campylobacterota bacterium]